MCFLPSLSPYAQLSKYITLTPISKLTLKRCKYLNMQLHFPKCIFKRCKVPHYCLPIVHFSPQLKQGILCVDCIFISILPSFLK
jgi:hypothetical protein